SVNARFPASLPETTPFFVRCSTSRPSGTSSLPPVPTVSPFATAPAAPPSALHREVPPYAAWIVNASATGAFAVSGAPIVPASGACAPGTALGWGYADGAQVLVVGEGSGTCSGWYLLYTADSDELYWVSGAYLSTTPS